MAVVKVTKELEWESGRVVLRASASLSGPAAGDLDAQIALRKELVETLREEGARLGWSHAPKRPVEFSTRADLDRHGVPVWLTVSATTVGPPAA